MATKPSIPAAYTTSTRPSSNKRPSFTAPRASGAPVAQLKRPCSQAAPSQRDASTNDDDGAPETVKTETNKRPSFSAPRASGAPDAKLKRPDTQAATPETVKMETNKRPSFAAPRSSGASVAQLKRLQMAAPLLLVTSYLLLLTSYFLRFI